MAEDKQILAGISRGSARRRRGPGPRGPPGVRRPTFTELDFDMALLDGRCTDALVGAASSGGVADSKVVCNTYETQGKCVSNSLCIWRSSNESCFCTFTGCSCRSPAEGATKSAVFDSSTMALVIIPVMIVFSLVGCYLLKAVTDCITRKCTYFFHTARTTLLK